MSNTLLRILAIPFGHKLISGRRFSPPELGGFILVGMLLIVYTIYATYKERTFLLSGICSIHTAKEPANVLKKFNAEAKTSWISNILNKYQKTIIEDNDKLQYVWWLGLVWLVKELIPEKDSKEAE